MKKIAPAAPAEKHRGYYGNKPVKAEQDTGGVKTTTQRMQVALKVPCRECPFRRDGAPGYLGGYTPEMYMKATFSAASLACHKSPGFHEGEIEKQRVCTGLAAFRANTGHIASIEAPSGALVPTAAHESTQFVGSDTETYFATAEEFCAHHKPGQE